MKTGVNSFDMLAPEPSPPRRLSRFGLGASYTGRTVPIGAFGANVARLDTTCGLCEKFLSCPSMCLQHASSEFLQIWCIGELPFLHTFPVISSWNSRTSAEWCDRDCLECSLSEVVIWRYFAIGKGSDVILNVSLCEGIIGQCLAIGKGSGRIAGWIKTWYDIIECLFLPRFPCSPAKPMKRCRVH